jgi:hypothetical protein
VTPDLALLTARSNLDPVTGLQQREDGIWELVSPDGNASARLAIPGWLRGFSSTAIAAVPSGRRLLIGNETQAARLYAEAEAHFRADGEAISPCLYTETGVYEAPDTRILAANAERYLKGRLYRELAERLDVPMASYKVVRRLRDGICVSYCHFQTGILLPITDLLMLPGDIPVPFTRLREASEWVREEDGEPPCLYVHPELPASLLESWRIA